MIMLQFDSVTRAEASGSVIDGRLRLADTPPISPDWFPCGVYRMSDSSIIVVDEPLSIAELRAAADASVPGWASALLVCTVLTPDPDPFPMIEIELVRPAGVGWAEAAFCAACAAADDAFTDDRHVDAVVRVDGRPVRVRASLDDHSGWSGAVSELSGGGARRG